MNHFIEVFVESNCQSCEEVLGVVSAFAERMSIAVATFTRDRNPGMFRERRVLISPATFVNGKLAFYGSFSTAALQHYLLQEVHKQLPINYKEKNHATH